MISWEFLGSPEQIRAQVFYIHELTEVIIVGKDDFIFAALQVVASGFKVFNNSQKLYSYKSHIKTEVEKYTTNIGVWKVCSKPLAFNDFDIFGLKQKFAPNHYYHQQPYSG